VFLTIEVLNYKSVANGNKTVVEQSVSKITTNLSQLVKEVETKVVGVTTYRSNQLISSGSGVVYEFDNAKKIVTIITNFHVIDRAEEIRVTFANGESSIASLIGKDQLTDLAVLSVQVDFVVAPFKIGDSSLTSVGEYVIAIGSPLGLEFQGSTTFGIISGKDRIVSVDLNNDGKDDWDSLVVQTDAAINPGNSGGALINLAGELIGVTSMKIASQNVEGMGFAIPVNEIITIVEQLKANGQVLRPMLGVSGYGVSDLTNSEKGFYNIDLSLNKGVLITNVVKGSAADKAGLYSGDIIVKLNDVEILNFKQFRKELYTKFVDEKVKIEIIRGKQTLTVEAVLK
jgi:serine protease Do